jgi:hypothetical protein
MLLPLRGLSRPGGLHKDVRNAAVRLALVGDFLLQASATAYCR